eukprot:jgi/Bigna1/130442/aug1.11_g5150
MSAEGGRAPELSVLYESDKDGVILQNSKIFFMDKHPELRLPDYMPKKSEREERMKRRDAQRKKQPAKERKNISHSSFQQDMEELFLSPPPREKRLVKAIKDKSNEKGEGSGSLQGDPHEERKKKMENEEYELSAPGGLPLIGSILDERDSRQEALDRKRLFRELLQTRKEGGGINCLPYPLADLEGVRSLPWEDEIAWGGGGTNKRSAAAGNLGGGKSSRVAAAALAGGNDGDDDDGDDEPLVPVVNDSEDDDDEDEDEDEDDSQEKKNHSTNENDDGNDATRSRDNAHSSNRSSSSYTKAAGETGSARWHDKGPRGLLKPTLFVTGEGEGTLHGGNRTAQQQALHQFHRDQPTTGTQQKGGGNGQNSWWEHNIVSSGNRGGGGGGGGGMGIKKIYATNKYRYTITEIGQQLMKQKQKRQQMLADAALERKRRQQGRGGKGGGGQVSWRGGSYNRGGGGGRGRRFVNTDGKSSTGEAQQEITAANGREEQSATMSLSSSSSSSSQLWGRIKLDTEAMLRGWLKALDLESRQRIHRAAADYERRVLIRLRRMRRQRLRQLNSSSGSGRSGNGMIIYGNNELVGGGDYGSSSASTASRFYLGGSRSSNNNRRRSSSSAASSRNPNQPLVEALRLAHMNAEQREIFLKYVRYRISCRREKKPGSESLLGALMPFFYHNDDDEEAAAEEEEEEEDQDGRGGAFPGGVSSSIYGGSSSNNISQWSSSRRRLGGGRNGSSSSQRGGFGGWSDLSVGDLRDILSFGLKRYYDRARAPMEEKDEMTQQERNRLEAMKWMQISSPSPTSSSNLTGSNVKDGADRIVGGVSRPSSSSHNGGNDQQGRLSSSSLGGRQRRGDGEEGEAAHSKRGNRKLGVWRVNNDFASSAWDYIKQEGNGDDDENDGGDNDDDDEKYEDDDFTTYQRPPDLDPFNIGVDYTDKYKAHARSRRKVEKEVNVQHLGPAQKLDEVWFPHRLAHNVLARHHKLPLRFRDQKLTDGVGYVVKLGKESKKLEDDKVSKSWKKHSASEGRVVLFEYIEQNPALIANTGMASLILKYHRKKANEEDLNPPDPELGRKQVLTMDDPSPFDLGDVLPNFPIQCMKNMLFSAPIFPQDITQYDDDDDDDDDGDDGDEKKQGGGSSSSSSGDRKTTNGTTAQSGDDNNSARREQKRRRRKQR